MHSTYYYNPIYYRRTQQLIIIFFSLSWLLSNINGRISSHEEEGNLQCNPRTKHLFGRFFLQRFFDARQELGMEDLRVGISDFISIPASILTYLTLNL